VSAKAKPGYWYPLSFEQQNTASMQQRAIVEEQKRKIMKMKIGDRSEWTVSIHVRLDIGHALDHVPKRE
jgi:hypothetical protein